MLRKIGKSFMGLLVITVLPHCGQNDAGNFYSNSGVVGGSNSNPSPSSTAAPGISYTPIAVAPPCLSGQGSVFDADEIDGIENRRQQCSKMLGINVQKIKLYSSKMGQINIAEDEALLVSVEAARQGFSLKINQGPGKIMGGLCIIMRGSSNVAKVDVLSEIKGVYVTALGDQSKVTLAVKKPLGKVSQSFNAWLGGNKALLEVSGDGAYSCPQVRYSGNSASMTCPR